MELLVPGANPNEFAMLVETLTRRRLATASRDGARDQVLRARIESRLVQILCTAVSASERHAGLRIPIDLAAVVLCGTQAAPGRLTSIGPGGVFVDVPLQASVDDEVVIATGRPRSAAGGAFEARGRVAWLASADGRTRGGFGMRFHMKTGDEEQQLRCLVVDLLEEHVFRR